jgi:hypothetical protein
MPSHDISDKCVAAYLLSSCRKRRQNIPERTKVLVNKGKFVLGLFQCESMNLLFLRFKDASV